MIFESREDYHAWWPPVHDSSCISKSRDFVQFWPFRGLEPMIFGSREDFDAMWPPVHDSCCIGKSRDFGQFWTFSWVLLHQSIMDVQSQSNNKVTTMHLSLRSLVSLNLSPTFGSWRSNSCRLVGGAISFVGIVCIGLVLLPILTKINVSCYITILLQFSIC